MQGGRDERRDGLRRRGVDPSPQGERAGPAWPYPRILAHRGGGSLGPENTIAALRCAQAMDFSAVEFDTMLSRDGVAVLMHDPEFGRTVHACGKVSDFDASEMADMDAGSWHSSRYAGEAVPTLIDAMQYCARHGLWTNIEIKPAPHAEEATGRQVAAEAWAFHRETRSARAEDEFSWMPLLSSFSMSALIAAAAESPVMPRALLLERMPPDWRSRMERCGARALHLRHAAVTQAVVESVKAAGYGLMCYTVNDVDRARQLLAWGVDALCTDRLDRIGADFADRILPHAG